MPAGVDEDGLEVGRLTMLHGTAELRLDILACFRAQQIGEVATEQLGVRVPGGSFRCGVRVHETAVHVVQARRHHEAVDQPHVHVLQAVDHRGHILNPPFTMRQRGRVSAGTQIRSRESTSSQPGTYSASSNPSSRYASRVASVSPQVSSVTGPRASIDEAWRTSRAYLSGVRNLASTPGLSIWFRSRSTSQIPIQAPDSCRPTKVASGSGSNAGRWCPQ